MTGLMTGLATERTIMQATMTEMTDPTISVIHDDIQSPSEPTTPFVAPDWLVGSIPALAGAITLAIKPLGPLRNRFLARMVEMAGMGGFPVTPTSEDMVELLSSKLTTPPDEATKAV